MAGDAVLAAATEFHADALSDVLGLIRSRLIDGAYDVLSNHHEDVIEIDSGAHHHSHPLTRAEAEMIERAIWSSGGDMTMSALLAKIKAQLQTNGFTLVGDHLDITVRLREAAATTEESSRVAR